MKIFSILFSLLLLILTSQCASQNASDLENARFALDQGDYTTAITKATEFLTDNPGDAQASRILASAYFARSGLDFLDIAEALLDLDLNTTTNFQAIANILPTTVDLDDLRSAITTLEAMTNVNDADVTDDETLADAVFDLGLMQSVEHFALGAYGSDFFGTFDVTKITDTQRGDVQADLVAFDNHFIASGVDPTKADSSFLNEIRQTFCVLEPISAGAGFTLAEYQAFVGCQLSTSPATFNTAALTAAIATCAAINPETQAAGVKSCYAANTAL